MNILYIHQYFNTPLEPGGTRSYWIAKELIKDGHQVTMLTSNRNSNEKTKSLDIDGINVIYLNTEYSQSMSVISRANAFLSFVYKSILQARRLENIDLVIATSTPLTVGITALYLKKFKKWPYIFEVRDLWPEVPIQMGAFKNPVLIKLTRWFEKMIYINAEHVIALSPGMQEGVIKYVDKEKTSMIPNMAKIDQFWPREKNRSLMKNMGLNPNSFKIIHFGTMGIANGVKSIIKAAELLSSDKSIEFLFVGRGSQKASLKKYCTINNISNVKFFDRYPMKELSEIVNFCDVSIVSFLDLPILYTNSPNKLFDSLSAGKPIIVNSAGWTKDMVEEHSCGFYVNPNKPEELVNKILFLKSNPVIKKEMGKQARLLAETKYDKSIQCKKIIEVVELSL